MKALLVEDGLVSYRSDYAQPEPGADEALIQVKLAGICATDLEIIKGYADFSGVLGHEFVGRVVEVGSGVSGAWGGQRVVGSINLGCDTCEICLRDGPSHCPHRRVLGIRGKDGAFAEYLTLPVGNLLAVPGNIPDEVAVFTEPLAAALRIREQVRVRPAARVAVIGPGRLGLLCAQVLALGGTEVAVLGRRLTSLTLPEYLGLQTGLVSKAVDKQFDVVVDTTGAEAGFVEAFRLVRSRGLVVMKSTFSGKANVDLSRLVVDEITVVGSRCGPFAPALRLLARSEVQVTPLIDARYPLAQAKLALDHAARPGVRKVLLQIGIPVSGSE